MSESFEPNDRRAYWAGVTDTRRFIARALDRVAWNMAAMRSTGRLDNMIRMMTAYYGRGTDGNRDDTSLLDAGEQGEVTEMHVNLIRPVIQNTLSIIAGTRPAVKPVATNGDSATAAQTRLAAALHEYYDRKTNAKPLEIECVRGGLIASSWWLMQGWTPSAGIEIAYNEASDSVVYEGDIELFTVPPWRVASSPGAQNEHSRNWVMFRRRASRHELIAKAPNDHIRESLVKGIATHDGSNYVNTILSRATTGLTARLDALLGEDIRLEDEVWVWELRHLPCPELPMGRFVRFVEPRLILWDSLQGGVPQHDQASDAEPEQKPVKYHYEELHAYEWCPERIVGTPHGYSMMFDMLGLQDFHDLCTASIGTTINLFGMPHLWSPNGGAPSVHQMETGPTIIESPVKPELISFNALKPEVVQAAEWAKSLMSQMAALNDTVTGNPQKGMPASAQALQRAQAVQYHQVSQDEWVRLVERNANGRLRLLKRFARTERVAEIAGSSGGWELANWKNDDIAGVERFSVEPINPMSATFEGRQAIAEQMGLQGEMLLDFITTGSMKKVTEQKTLNLELVERNKALLLKGVGLPPVNVAASIQQGAPVFEPQPGQEYVTILKSDPHHLAILAYLSVVSSPSSRTDEMLMRAALDCVSESLRLWMQLNPDECQAFGIPPLPSTAQMPIQAPGGAMQQQQQQQQQQQARPPAPQGVTPDQPPGMPPTPRNPITGEQETQNLALTGI